MEQAKEQELQSKVNALIKLKCKMNTTKEAMEQLKDELYNDLAKEGASSLATKYGKVYTVSCSRGSLNMDKTILALEEAKNKDVSIEDCKSYTDCSYLVLKVSEGVDPKLI